MNLELVANKFKIKHGVDEYSKIIMNDINLFILCSYPGTTLKIFSLDTLDLVKEVEVTADKMKLVSTKYLILSDSHNNVLYLYKQSGDFEKLDQANLRQLLDGDKFYFMSLDKSLTILFHDGLRAKFISFDELFNIPMI
jgi:hypothetical protein